MGRLRSGSPTPKLQVGKGGEVGRPPHRPHHPTTHPPCKGVGGCGGGEPEPTRNRVVVIAAADRWGPFADGIDAAERVARLRSLRAIVHLTTGPRGDTLAQALRLSERDPDHLPAAVDALTALAPIDRRHVLASFARLHRTA